MSTNGSQDSYYKVSFTRDHSWFAQVVTKGKNNFDEKALGILHAQGGTSFRWHNETDLYSVIRYRIQLKGSI